MTAEVVGAAASPNTKGTQSQAPPWAGAQRTPTVTVIVPALNEAENLPHVLPLIPSWVHEVILVHDRCTDDTVDVARRVLPGIRVVANDGRPGKGNALRAGFEAANGNILIAIDADGSNDPREIPLFVGALLSGADYAKGTRFVHGGGTADMTVIRRLGNKGFVLLVRTLFGACYSDLCYGYNAFWKRVLPQLDLDADGFEIETMLNIRAFKSGLAIKEVPSFEATRIHGVGHLATFRDGWRVLRTIWRERFGSAAPLSRQPGQVAAVLEEAVSTSRRVTRRHRTRVLCIFGTRREAIRMAPVIRALEARPDQFEVRVCLTGECRQLLDQMFELFEIRPDHDLTIMRERRTLTHITTEVLTGLERVLADERPSWVLVPGDSTTTMAASLAASYAGARVGHLEAGLRTGNVAEPHPEETNRRVATALADVHFAPTQLAAANLRAEGIPDDQICITGDTAVDAFHAVAGLPFEMSGTWLEPLAADSRRLILATVHQRENHGPAVREICAGLRSIARNCKDVHLVVPVHLSPSMQEPVREALAGFGNVTLTEPLDYRCAVWLLGRCHFVITDAGGLHEDSEGVGKPVLVVGDAEERVEGIDAGAARLVRADKKEIAWWAARLLHDETTYQEMATVTIPYGDGHAAERIVDLLADDRSGLPVPAEGSLVGSVMAAVAKEVI